MKFDCIIANPPYAKIGCDITRNVIEQNPDSNYAMLGTRSMFKPFYTDTLACAFVQTGKYELGSNTKLDWGVEQAILLATNGWTEVVDNRKRKDRQPFQEGVSVGRTSHLVGAPVAIERAAWNHRTRSTTLVQVNKSGPALGGAMDRKTCSLVETDSNIPHVTAHGDVYDQKLKNGYVYASFETFEEACECAIDIISWTDPTDSHYRCVRWGFVCGLKPHERFEK